MLMLQHTCYLLACLFLILSIRSLSSPRTAILGNRLGILGILISIFAAMSSLGLTPLLLSFCTILLGAIIGIYFALKVKITALPQMIAVFNCLGGLAAVCIALAAVLSSSPKLFDNTFGMIIGGIAFSGSIIAFAKLQGLMKGTPFHFRFQHFINIALLLMVVLMSIIFIFHPNFYLFFAMTFMVMVLGCLLVLPIGGADMPVVISLLNGYSGWAAVGIGMSLNSQILIIIGTIIGSGGIILAYIMLKAMNRSVINILTGGFSGNSGNQHLSSNASIPNSASPQDAAFIMENASKIIIVPGYGMAAAQAQHSLKNLATVLHDKYHADVKFAIHPVAGRMPGHMNVLLAEANIDYKDVYELSDINQEFSSADVAYVIGANDITNPSAKRDPSSPLFGMPVLDVEKAKTVFFVKRSLSSGYSGVDNPLFFAPNTIMLYGDAKAITEQIVKYLEQ